MCQIILFADKIECFITAIKYTDNKKIQTTILSDQHEGHYPIMSEYGNLIAPMNNDKISHHMDSARSYY